MKTIGVTTALVLAGLAFFSIPAAADCACFCVNGSLKTLCSTVEEAQANPTMCNPDTYRECPSEFKGEPGASYEAPHEDATNCRELRVYDASRGAFTSVKACDVLSAS